MIKARDLETNVETDTPEVRTDADLLRAAAEKLRQLAKQATPGPWQIEWTYGGTEPQAIFRMHPDHPDDPDLSEGVGIMDEPWDNAWVATVHPGVAEPLAAWLDEAVDRLDERALAVARVIVGEAGGEASDGGMAAKVARVTADRDAARLELGELKQQERVQVRQLRAQVEQLKLEWDRNAALEEVTGLRRLVDEVQRELAATQKCYDAAVDRAEKAEQELAKVRRVGQDYENIKVALQNACEGRDDAYRRAGDERRRAEKAEELLFRFAAESREVLDRSALDEMVRAGEDAGLYDLPEDARCERTDPPCVMHPEASCTWPGDCLCFDPPAPADREAWETVGKLAHLLGYVLGQYDRMVQIHSKVVMDTPEDRELHERTVDTMRRAVIPVRDLLAQTEAALPACVRDDEGGQE